MIKSIIQNPVIDGILERFLNGNKLKHMQLPMSLSKPGFGYRVETFSVTDGAIQNLLVKDRKTLIRTIESYLCRLRPRL